MSRNLRKRDYQGKNKERGVPGGILERVWWGGGTEQVQCTWNKMNQRERDTDGAGWRGSLDLVIQTFRGHVKSSIIQIQILYKFLSVTENH